MRQRVSHRNFSACSGFWPFGDGKRPSYQVGAGGTTYTFMSRETHQPDRIYKDHQHQALASHVSSHPKYTHRPQVEVCRFVVDNTRRNQKTRNGFFQESDIHRLVRVRRVRRRKQTRRGCSKSKETRLYCRCPSSGLGLLCSSPGIPILTILCIPIRIRLQILHSSCLRRSCCLRRSSCLRRTGYLRSHSIRRLPELRSIPELRRLPKLRSL